MDSPIPPPRESVYERGSASLFGAAQICEIVVRGAWGGGTPRRISPNLEFASLPLGMGLYEPGSRLGYVYFLTEGIVSLLYVLKNGASAEIAVTGCEGVVGVSLFMGGETTPSRAVVQCAGHAYR